tara:strand:+ start:148 stop:1065 length:918 start_codon:yes stop_codon:yes gene_type:complete
MIIENQSNIKVHFAGAENLIRSNLILKGVKSKYALFTIFPFLCDAFGIKHGYQNKGLTYDEVARNNMENSRHCIQDSGLFSLMFGSYKGDKSEEFIMEWYEKLVQTTREGGFLGSVVEVDCQKVLGVEKAWELRERMKIELPQNRQINVFHKEDGQKGLDRMIEFSDYIAISVPELRHLGKKNYTVQLANYIKNKKPEIDIHLLGCTENKLLKELSFCSSADSTSWVSFNKYGFFKYNDGRITHSIKKSDVLREVLFEAYRERTIELFEMSKVKMSESLIYYHCCDLMQLDYLIKQYSHYAGNQD